MGDHGKQAEPLNYMGFPFKVSSVDEIARETMKAQRIEIIDGYCFAMNDGKLYVSEGIP